MQYIENLKLRSNAVRYRPQNLVKSSDTVEWEEQPGTILLNQARDFYMQHFTLNHSSYYYRVKRNGDPTINVVGKLFIITRKKGG